ncbi:hypothetical protein Tco_0568466 [Tanacetum coccineum]
MSEIPNNGFMNLLNASMTPEQFQQYQQEQQQAFFRWQQSQVLNREFQDLQQNPPSFNSETSQSLTQPQQVDSPKKGGRKKTKAKRGKNVEDEPQEPCYGVTTPEALSSEVLGFDSIKELYAIDEDFGNIWMELETKQHRGRTLQPKKEDQFDEYERFRAIRKRINSDYFIACPTSVNYMKITPAAHHSYSCSDGH